MIHVEEPEPVVGGPVAGTKRDSPLVGVFGGGKIAEELVSGGKTAVGVVTGGFYFEGAPVLIGSLLIFAMRHKRPSQAGEGGGQSGALCRGLPASFDGS